MDDTGAEGEACLAPTSILFDSNDVGPWRAKPRPTGITPIAAFSPSGPELVNATTAVRLFRISRHAAGADVSRSNRDTQKCLMDSSRTSDLSCL